MEKVTRKTDKELNGHARFCRTSLKRQRRTCCDTSLKRQRRTCCDTSLKRQRRFFAARFRLVWPREDLRWRFRLVWPREDLRCALQACVASRRPSLALQACVADSRLLRCFCRLPSAWQAVSPPAHSSTSPGMSLLPSLVAWWPCGTRPLSSPPTPCTAVPRTPGWPAGFICSARRSAVRCWVTAAWWCSRSMTPSPALRKTPSP